METFFCSPTCSLLISTYLIVYVLFIALLSFPANKRKHTTYPKISTAPKIDFLTVGADTPTPTPPGPAGVSLGQTDREKGPDRQREGET